VFISEGGRRGLVISLSRWHSKRSQILIKFLVLSQFLWQISSSGGIASHNYCSSVLIMAFSSTGFFIY